MADLRDQAPQGLQALWAARAVAVIGASDRAGALGRLPVDFLQRYDYRGTIVPVRPDGAPVAGLRSYPSVVAARAEGVPVDVAMIMVSAARVADAVDDLVEAGVGCAIICSSGFAETGEDGARLQRAIVERAGAGGLRIVGPNCIGTVGVGTGQVTSFSPLFAGTHTELVHGTLGFVSQSGALGYGAVSLAFDRGLGLGWVVNTGNESDVTSVEAMAAIAREPGCQGVIGYLESVTDLAGLRAIAARGVPVAVLKAGRSEAGARAAASHTGALAAGDRVVDAALRQAGVVRVSDVEELLDVAEVMSLPRPSGRRVAVVTTSGGSGILAADAIEATGLSLAPLSQATRAALDEIVPAFGSSQNPVDVTATVMSDSTLFDRALDVIVDDDSVDSIIACFCVLTGGDVDTIVGSLARVAQRSGKPVLAVRTGAAHLAPSAAQAMRAAGLPCFVTPARAVRALSALCDFATPVADRPDVVALGAVAPDPRASEADLKDLLSRNGIAVPHGRFATGPDDAAAAVTEAGGLAVLKAVVPGLVHKSEAGGVRLGVTADLAGQVWRDLAALGGRVWVEEQVSGGVEALVGVTPSPLGAVLTVGVGGVLTEVVADVALRVLPVSRDDVEAMIDETRLATLLAGVRGAGPADRAALVETVVSLAAVVAGWAEGFELDLNPVTVLPEGRGVRVLDAAYIAPVAD